MFECWSGEAFYVGFDDVVDRMPFDAFAQCPQGVMAAALRPESVGVADEALFIDGLHYFDKTCLHQFVFQCRNAQWSLFLAPGFSRLLKNTVFRLPVCGTRMCRKDVPSFSMAVSR